MSAPSFLSEASFGGSTSSEAGRYFHVLVLLVESSDEPWGPLLTELTEFVLKIDFGAHVCSLVAINRMHMNVLHLIISDKPILLKGAFCIGLF